MAAGMSPGQVAGNCLSLAANENDPDRRAELRAEAAVHAQLAVAGQLEQIAKLMQDLDRHVEYLGQRVA